MKIKCPHCGEEIELDNAAYASVLKQVRTQEFDNEVQRRVSYESEKIKKTFDEELEYYKNYKLQSSVKVIGEDLEHYVENEFRKIMPYMFAEAEFIKDNDQSQGSKGDFIFRQYHEGVEVLSVMIDCKDEADVSKNKKRNSDHFAKLDRDREQKRCEYAFLVSMLEKENDLYNAGITEVPSGEFKKMYVVRPQYFLQLLGLLSNMAKDKSALKHEIAGLELQQSAVNEFSDNLDIHKEKFVRNHERSQGNINTALQHIDSSIAELEKARERLIVGLGQSETAGKVVQGLTVKKIVKVKKN